MGMKILPSMSNRWGVYCISMEKGILHPPVHFMIRGFYHPYLQVRIEYVLLQFTK